MSDIVFIDTCEVELKGGKKPKDSWMKNWTLEQRIDKFFEFCRVFDDREDSLLRDEYQIFSHRLHWHEHPFCDFMRQHVHSNRDRLYYTLVFSFTNEHWGTLMKLFNEGKQATERHFEENRHARNDLFQIYYPKGTNVKRWILDGPERAADAMAHVLDEAERSGKPYTMMQFAKIMEAYFKQHQNFRSPLYPCKNAARYLAMSFPHLVDPESVLFGGTGFFDGLHQVFGGENLNGKVKYEIDKDGQFVPTNKHGKLWMEQMVTLVEDERNPMREQKWLNCEDKLCFFWKKISIAHGAKKPTKNIPYTWIFPDNFNLGNNPSFLQNVIDRNLMY